MRHLSQAVGLELIKMPYLQLPNSLLKYDHQSFVSVRVFERVGVTNSQVEKDWESAIGRGLKGRNIFLLPFQHLHLQTAGPLLPVEPWRWTVDGATRTLGVTGAAATSLSTHLPEGGAVPHLACFTLGRLYRGTRRWRCGGSAGPVGSEVRWVHRPGKSSKCSRDAGSGCLELLMLLL